MAKQNIDRVCNVRMDASPGTDYNSMIIANIYGTALRKKGGSSSSTGSMSEMSKEQEQQEESVQEQEQEQEEEQEQEKRMKNPLINYNHRPPSKQKKFYRSICKKEAITVRFLSAYCIVRKFDANCRCIICSCFARS